MTDPFDGRDADSDPAADDDLLDDEGEEQGADGEGTEDDSPEVVVELSGSSDGRAAASDRVVLVGGPRSGAVVPSSAAGAATRAGSAVAVPDVAAALAPGSALMLVHRPGRYARRVPGALARVHTDFGASGLALGASVGLPHVGEAEAEAFLQSCGVAAVRIADPEGFALPTDLIADPVLTPNQQGKVGYVAAAPAAGTAATTAWNQRVVRAQRSGGANVLMTPGRSLDPADGVAALADASQALDDLLSEVRADELPAWNLTLPHAWLIDRALRNLLLSELVDRDDVDVWHVRVRWPLIKKSYGQNLDTNLLDGYAELARTARREGKALILPTTGLTGWVTLGWGTTGFGTGSSAATQAWADTPRIAARKGVTRTTVHRHQVSPLLHTITVDSHDNLRRSLPAASYPACPCPYCAALSAAPTWQPEIAAAHVIYAMGELAARVASARPADREQVISGTVSTAKALFDGLTPAQALDAKEAPDHLAVWDAALP